MPFASGDPRSVGRALHRAVVVAAAATMASRDVARAQQPVPRPPVDTAPPAALAFQGTTVIDVATGRRLPNQTIVVVGNRIRAVGPAGRTPLPAGTRVRRADGTYVIPGLWDMHVHIFGFPNTFFPLFLANGVTGVRDMGTPFLDSMVQWRREIRDGRRAGPRLVTAGPSITGGDGAPIPPIMGRYKHHQVSAATPDQGRRIVDSLKQGGADLIKVYSGLKREVYFAIAAEARRVGLPFGGHLPDSIAIGEASDSGLHSTEHGIGLGVCRDSSAVDGRVQKTLDVAQCRALAARFRRNDTWVMPGPMVNTRECSACQLPWYREQDRYWPDSLFDPFNSNPGAPPHEPRAWNRSLEQWAAIYTSPAMLKVARDAGFRFISGTDVAPIKMGTRPGFSLQAQLWDLTRSGLTPLEALQAATLNPAKYFYAADSMGTVAPGKVADLVFLDADPLQDIFNTRRIRAVVADGRFYDRADLDSLLIGVERLAKASRRP